VNQTFLKKFYEIKTTQHSLPSRRMFRALLHQYGLFLMRACKIIGKIIKVVARLLEGEEAKAANGLLRKKYGFTYTFFNSLQGIYLRSKLLFYEVIPKVLTN
jgi:hypothetical protein